jgi:hypothetical protein
MDLCGNFTASAETFTACFAALSREITFDGLAAAGRGIVQHAREPEMSAAAEQLPDHEADFV